MRTSIISEGYGDISTAVFYKFYKFPYKVPDPLAEVPYYKSFKVMYKGSKNDLGLEEFVEYDFKYFIENAGKYSDVILPNLFSPSLLNLTGKSIDSLEQISSYMFPTLSTERLERGYNVFFGSTTVNDKTAYLFPSEQDVWKIELYENVVEENNSEFGGFVDCEWLESQGKEITNKPFMSILLGPSPENINNPSSFYYEEDPKKEEREGEEGNYTKLKEELYSPKAVIVVVSPDSSVPEVNLSYRMWFVSKDPNRNMNKYLLRNDEYWSSREGVDIIGPSSTSDLLLMDLRNGTLVGNNSVEISRTPILQRKLSKLKDKEFSDYRRYDTGERTGESFVSLVDDNIGNNPFYSKEWINLENLEELLSEQVFVRCDPPGSARISPNGIMTLAEGVNPSFTIYENSGYLLNEEDPFQIEPLSHKTEAVVSGNKMWKVLTTGGWTEDDLKKSGGEIVIKFNPIIGQIYLTLTDLSNSSNIGYPEDFENWYEKFGEKSNEVFEQLYIEEEGKEEFNYILPGAEFKNVSPNKILYLHVPFLKEYQPETLYVLNYLGSFTNVVERIPEEIEDKKWKVKVNAMDFSNANWELRLRKRILRINVIDGIGFEVSNPRITVDYGMKETALEFYPINETVDSVEVEVEGVADPDQEPQAISIMKLDSTSAPGSVVSTSFYNRTLVSLSRTEDGIYRLTWRGVLSNDGIFNDYNIRLK